ncbi:MAG: diguanylate cyclase [Candidatus Omnitrophica bacterium]|nr:diguanylate cyclase [Candidatus Omnitrophota bacterium]
MQHSPSEVLAQGVTISLGVASFPEDAQADLELLRLADQRLYQAKHAGRNRVCAT